MYSVALLQSLLVPHPHLRVQNRRAISPSLWLRRLEVTAKPRRGFRPSAALRRPASDGSPATTNSFLPLLSLTETFRRHLGLLVHLAAAAAFLIGFGARASTPASAAVAPPTVVSSSVNETETSDAIIEQSAENEELKAALEAWKSKTYALTVPLRIVALRGSLPPSWIKDFIQVQGKRLHMNLEYRGGLESIFSDLSSASEKGHLQPKSAMAADIISLGDSWLNFAIIRGLIEPVKHIEEQEWFKNLSNKWKVHLRRNDKGELDPNGYIWGAPYRWGPMVIAYKKEKFRRHNLRPIEDWSDLWRTELAGKVAMVDSSREVIGAVLKYMGSSYNTKDFETQVVGGRKAVLHNLRALQRQVRLFDSVHYLKAFSSGDVWVAVGWSSDVIPVAKRMSNVAVIVPKSGSSLWADLWVIPYATRFKTDKIGGRVRSPSPLIYQWFEFCLQIASALPFQQEVIPGASPIVFDQYSGGPMESTKGKPKLDTNLVDGVPTPEILAKCEFLEPLSEKALEDHEWLISSMDKSGSGWIRNILYSSSALFNSRGGNKKS
uniref:Uncharacterized protein n=1 Tax=Musa acuminata subsp. malaccensis TaxID=214687 RepID=A0A804JC12_MUSAM|nr:PREDICTED: uncharacterized protein LOC103986645 [Musa acuminata subsp. malaccensis]